MHAFNSHGEVSLIQEAGASLQDLETAKAGTPLPVSDESVYFLLTHVQHFLKRRLDEAVSQWSGSKNGRTKSLLACDSKAIRHSALEVL